MLFHYHICINHLPSIFSVTSKEIFLTAKKQKKSKLWWHWYTKCSHWDFSRNHIRRQKVHELWLPGFENKSLLIRQEESSSDNISHLWCYNTKTCEEILRKKKNNLMMEEVYMSIFVLYYCFSLSFCSQCLSLCLWVFLKGIIYKSRKGIHLWLFNVNII